MLNYLKARFPKHHRAILAVSAVAALGATAAYEHQARASDSCCFAGSACCHPGAACCAHRQARENAAK
jgi:hypothetical protein